jgi:hypothetical protein
MSPLGCSSPVQPVRSQNAMAQPVFLPPPLPKDATPWTLLSWGSTPLHGMSRSPLLPTPATRAAIESHSLGVPCPYSAYRKRESTSRPASLVAQLHRKSSPTLSQPVQARTRYRTGNPLAVPIPPATEPLPGFLNLSAAFFLSPPSHHFQMGGAHGVAPSRGLHFPRSPDSSSLPAYPLDVIPSRCATSFPRKRVHWARTPYLG